MRQRLPIQEEEPGGLSRRGLLIGGLLAGGLAIGWTLWPRRHLPALTLTPGETALGGYLKLGKDGHVTVIFPQTEFGQGNMTLIAQILADELGADWRTIAVEQAPVNAFYANPHLSQIWNDHWFTEEPVQGTDDALDLSALEPVLREAGAAARILLCKAAARRWNIAWASCNTENGFVTFENKRLRFSQLVEDAAREDLPKRPMLRTGRRPLVGQRLLRLDVPAKVDGSLTYAGDIRLPDMVHASIRMGTELADHDAKAAARVPGFAGLVAGDGWLAAAANSWWAAEQALVAAKPRFKPMKGATDDRSVAARLKAGLSESGKRLAEAGAPDPLLDAKALSRDYYARFAPHMALEPLTAAAALDDGQLTLWIASNLPFAARAMAAEAAGLSADNVTVVSLQGGGSFGRRYEAEVAAQVARMAKELGRPVMLQWPREQDIARDRMRPAAMARVTAKTGAGGRIEALRINIASADALAEMRARLFDAQSAQDAQASEAGSAGASSLPQDLHPYAIPAWALDFHAVDLGHPSGLLRGGPAGFSTFFIESFMDEASKAGGIDPFSIRMSMLAGHPRMAMCLSRVAGRGEWKGGTQGSGQGLACFSQGTSSIAVLAEARLDERQKVHVDRLVAVADIGRMLNPDIALQQIEGGLLHGLALATGAPVSLRNGRPQFRTMGEMSLPRLADMPAISIEIVSSAETPGPFGELALPPVAPAIANAIASASGQRFRHLPLGTA